MAKPPHVSQTPATQWLRERGIRFEEHPYVYVERGGTAESARALGVQEHAVIKTLVMQDESRRPLLVLMHGDRQVSTKELARQIGRKRIAPCDPAVAQRHSGYQVGGTSPFGVRKPMPIFVQRSILDLDRIYINGGRRGFLVSLAPGVLAKELKATPVECEIRPESD
jgi:Cys-tRNA(Pro) deacylase